MRFGVGELLLILIITLVIFGPSRLPELGKAFGDTLSSFKKHANKSFEDDTNEVEDDEDGK